MGDQTVTAAAAALDRRWRAPLTTAVTGHPGTGRDTVAAALTARFGVRALDTHAPPADRADADLAVHVLGAGVRDCDREFLAAQRRPVIVLSGKADLRGGPGRAGRLAAGAAADLQRPVYPVSGLLAAATVDDALHADLRRWADARIEVPVLAATFADHSEPQERRRRSLALAALGASGLRAALELLVEGPDLSAVALTARLRGLSGLAALVEPIRECGTAVAADRRRRRRRGLTVLAACGPDRDRLEARWIR